MTGNSRSSVETDIVLKRCVLCLYVEGYIGLMLRVNVVGLMCCTWRDRVNVVLEGCTWRDRVNVEG